MIKPAWYHIKNKQTSSQTQICAYRKGTKELSNHEEKSVGALLQSCVGHRSVNTEKDTKDIQIMKKKSAGIHGHMKRCSTPLII